jgi:pilus assembly protein Flp/PilA
MSKFSSAVINFIKGRRQGATAVEYGLLVTLIAAVIVATVASIGTAVEKGFTTVLSNL